MLDLIIAIIALPIFAMLIIVIGPIIYFHDKGPIFYNGLRLGMNGRVFKMYKIRTMKINALDIRNKDGSTYNSDDDPRLTGVGKVIRKMSIDEIPQLINIIRGDMSFIGPRPDLPEHMEYYDDTEKIKLTVLPGITGYNQAYYRNSVIWKERIMNDVYYVNHLTVWLDIKIVFKTIEKIILHKGIYIASNNQNEKEKCNE